MDPAENNFRYVGWRVVLVASLAMVATLPGRTVGLGLITEPLLEDLQLSRVRYSNLTIWATIIGALLSPVCGKAIDRWGVKTCLPAVIMLLGLTTISMSHYVTAANVIVFLILSRGFGQSSLSTASVTAVGKFFESHLGIALGVFSALVAVGFVLTIPTVDGLIGESNWRSCWFGIGGFLIALAAFTFLTILAKGQKQSQSNHNEVSVTWSSAMKTRFFWSFTVSVGLYYLVLSGLTLFCESVLSDLGFDRSIYIASMISMMIAGLFGNFLIGWLSAFWKTNYLLAISLLILAAVLLGLPSVKTSGQAIFLFFLYGICGGSFAVLFFVGYGKAYGPQHLGRIQGIAQTFGVFASAFGPKLFAETRSATGDYWLALQGLGIAAIALALVALLTPKPNRSTVKKSFLTQVESDKSSRI